MSKSYPPFLPGDEVKALDTRDGVEFGEKYSVVTCARVDGYWVCELVRQTRSSAKQNDEVCRLVQGDRIDKTFKTRADYLELVV